MLKLTALYCCVALFVIALVIPHSVSQDEFRETKVFFGTAARVTSSGARAYLGLTLLLVLLTHILPALLLWAAIIAETPRTLGVRVFLGAGGLVVALAASIALIAMALDGIHITGGGSANRFLLPWTLLCFVPHVIAFAMCVGSAITPHFALAVWASRKFGLS